MVTNPESGSMTTDLFPHVLDKCLGQAVEGKPVVLVMDSGGGGWV